MNNITEHVLLYCTENDNIRRRLWSKLIEQLGIDTYNKLLEFQPEEQLLILFNGLEQILSDSSENERCLTIVVKYFHTMLTSYMETYL